jgi:hypothetical protein
LVASQLLYDSGTKNEKLIAVRFDQSDQVVPRLLRAYQHYRLMDDYEALFRHLTSQPEVMPATLGPLRKLACKAVPSRQAVPEASVAGDGLPQPRKASPFVPGSPITEPKQFFGRKALLSQALDAIERRQPVQVLGETRMGKTSLLHQIKRHLPQNLAPVWVSAQDQSDEVALVRHAASTLGRADLNRALAVATPGSQAVLHAIEELAPFAWLVDEADVLARGEHPLSDGFQSKCRALCQSRKLLFVSASQDDLHFLLVARGLGSRFLNDSVAVFAGELELDACQMLLSPLGPEARTCALEQAGGFAYGLQLMGDDLWRDGQVHHACGRLDNTLRATFERWWQRRTSLERSLLERVQQGLAVDWNQEEVRSALMATIDRGLLAEKEGQLSIPGASWKGYVKLAG